MTKLRHLRLHEVALAKLADSPTGRRACLDLLERWLIDPSLASARPYLVQWESMLRDWPVARIAGLVLDPSGGETLRKCSPLGPLLTPRERWAALAEVNRR